MPKTIYDYAEEYHRLVPDPEWRQDPILDRWVIIASDRARRPIQTATVESPPPKKIDCPFCAGSEKATPDPVATYGNAEDWAVRIVPNKFPAVNADQGLHQVIVECPHHEPSLTGLPDANVNQVVRAYRDRILSLDEEPFVYGIIFKNFGADAGASLEHSHSQFIALPIVPPDVLEELRGALRYYQREEACVYCNLIEQSRPDRVILETEHHLAMCPFASRFPFEIWVLPKQHVSHFERIDEEQSKDLSRVLKSVLTRLETALDRPSYNYVIHTAPPDGGETPHYHWHLEIIPRLAKMAGFELGTGVHINPVPPEAAASILRRSSS